MQIYELANIIKNGGVVGCGGAGFPSYAKLNDGADTVILNCAECEPLLKLHRQLLAKHTYEIMSTLKTVSEAVNAENIIIAIKKSYKDAVDAVSSYLDAFENIKIAYLPEVYPAGDEVVTVYETTGRVVPPGQIPISVGVIVFNVETVYNIYRVVSENKGVTHKFVTVAGEVEKPITLRLPLGMSVKDAVSLAGDITCKNPVYLIGGPMTGKIGKAYDVITKTTNAILVIPKEHYIINKRKSNVSIDMKRAMASCCQCRICTDLCPRNLLGHPIEPHILMRNATSGAISENLYLDSMYCSSCGLCEMFSCSQSLSPRSLLAICKDTVKAKGIARNETPKQTCVKSEREYRQVSLKRLTSRLGLKKYDIPAPLDEREIKAKEYKLLLNQHIGVPSVPIVQKGDKVTLGQLLAEQNDALGVSLHSPSDGTVMEVNEKFILIKG